MFGVNIFNYIAKKCYVHYYYYYHEIPWVLFFYTITY
jgi:hypothetical protein